MISSPNSMEAESQETSFEVILISLSSEVNQTVNGSKKVKPEYATKTFILPKKKLKKDKNNKLTSKFKINFNNSQVTTG